MKEILLYIGINSWSASDFITAMNDAIGSDVCVRVNGNGGDVEYGWGMVAKFREHAGKKYIKVDGKAHSMYAFLLCYSDDSEALDVSTMILHRAAYPDWMENDPELFTPDVRANVVRVNGFLQKAFEAKVDVAKFEKLTGVTVKDLFSLDGRIEVTLTAADALKVGLINRVVKITPAKTAEIKSLYTEMAAKYSDIKIAATTPKDKKSKTEIKPKKMNIAEFKAKYPKTYAKAMKEGAKEEKDRVEACLVFIDIDPDGVKAAIEGGKPLSEKQKAEFGLKAMSKNTLTELGAEAPKVVKTKEQLEAEKTEKETALADFTALVKKGTGLAADKK